MINKTYPFLIFFCLIACKSSIQSPTLITDTNKIITKILDDEQLFKDLVSKPDTIFIIKTKLVNEKWPVKTNKFNLRYINSDKKNEDMINLSPTSFNDNRIRIDFGKITIQNDTAKVSFGIYEFQKFMIYDYKLYRKLNHWSIYSKTQRAR
ncbi:hypothetical protein OQX63_06075 [Pedobacter sp. PF22-3]|uniref:hypothetical protein n=1 Tax=Pedobacter sp. PF22-3 TaxID=2994467 RepID=UPI002245BA2C|nr:hypothetical protein [Pedobacter sp. PF22-3]MCX2493030.1 hypothetical protein [Pedobacter sp. PF22-3]